jgi:hypothetical protein
MLETIARGVESRRQVDVALAEGLGTAWAGVLVLVESMVSLDGLDEPVLDALEAALPSGATLHLVSDELISIVAPGQSLFDGWSLVESLRSVFAGQGVAVHVGLSSWPMEGPTVTDVFGAAVAALVEDRSRAPEPSDEEFVEIDGIELAFQGAGEFLSA